MKKTLSLFALIVIFAIGLNSCGPKDADIQKSVQAVLASNPDAAAVKASVEKKIVTLSGDVKDDATKAAIEAAAKVKGVKSVVNNLTVTPPVSATVATSGTTAQSETLMSGLKDALKDNPTVKYDVKDGVVTLTGEIKKSDLIKMMQKVQALHPVKINNKGLTIK